MEGQQAEGTLGYEKKIANSMNHDKTDDHGAEDPRPHTRARVCVSMSTRA
jgi:hypothetical protein